MSAPVARNHSVARVPRALRAGMSLVEVMISLAISATLLSAVAAAFSASAQSIEANDQFVRAAQAARISVNQIMAEVRKAKVKPSGTDEFVKSPTRLEFVTDTDVARSYELLNGALMMTVYDPLSPQTVRLAGNIEAVQFSTNGQSISMLVTVKVGGNKVTLTGSAVPRRLMEFK